MVVMRRSLMIQWRSWNLEICTLMWAQTRARQKKEPVFTIGGCNQDYKSRPLRSHERLFGANEKRYRMLSDAPATIKN